MNNYKRFYGCIVRSVDHIFKNFLNDSSIEEVYETQSSKNAHNVIIEIDGTLSGELVLNFPRTTLNHLTKKFNPTINPRSLKKFHADVAGEIANLITSSFANQLQFIKHSIKISPPEFDDDPIPIKALYENINVSFISSFGGFDIDLYYREES